MSVDSSIGSPILRLFMAPINFVPESVGNRFHHYQPLGRDATLTGVCHSRSDRRLGGPFQVRILELQ